MAKEEYPLSNLTEKIIGAAFQVHNRLGQGFQEKVYENALVEELRTNGLRVEQQKPLTVMYGGKPVGDFIADLLIEGSVLVELKANKAIDRSHENQLLNYLKSSGIEVGLLINFGESVQIRRKIFTPTK
ncbi:MAG: GxxExxY protein [Bacteroidota bacterium]|jgi:GxxExxY protein